MKHTPLTLVPLTFALSISFLACSSPPTEQLEAARKAMQQAKEQHADEFASSDWKNAQQAWDEAQSLIAKQKYTDAGELLIRAKSRFDKARDIARAKREELRKDIEGKRKTIDIRYEGLKSALAAEKFPPAAKKKLNESCQEIDKGIAKLKLEFDQGDYTLAMNTAMFTMRQVYEVEKEVEKSGKKH